MKTPPMFLLLILPLLAALALACGGDDSPDNDNTVPLAIGDDARVTGGDLVPVGEFSSLQQTGGGQPGVTVVGTGTASKAPDSAIVLITIVSGDAFFSGGAPRLELVAEEDIEPVLNFLEDRDVGEDEMKVNLFASSDFAPYGGVGAAQVNFLWRDIDGLTELIGDLENVVRQETEYGLNYLAVVFTVDDCETLERQAWEAAMADAVDRAEALADLAGVTTGNVTAISESPFASVVGVPTDGGCIEFERLGGTSGINFYSPTSSSSEVSVGAYLQVTFSIE